MTNEQVRAFMGLFYGMFLVDQARHVQGLRSDIVMVAATFLALLSFVMMSGDRR